MAEYTPPAVTRQSVLQDYLSTINNWHRDYIASGNGARGSEAMANYNRLGKLSELLSMVGSESSSPETNPFGVGGSAPTLPTENRFASGLSDAESRLRALLDNPDSIQQSGAYKFRVKQGEDALQRQMGAKGMLNSGNRLMELTKYGQDMASQEYDAQYGRLGNLLGNYTGGYTADRNSNINQFAAQSNAWNTAQGNADRNRLGFAQLNWEKSKPQFVSGGSRSSSGGSTFNAGGITGSWNPDTDPTIQRMNRDSSWNYDYSQGGQSLWRNTATGESAWSAGGREGNPTQTQFYGTPAWDRNSARRA